MTVLDIGCGWGSFAKFAAWHYGVEVVGVTVSKEQAKRAANPCRNLQVDIRLQDYRELDQKFDAVASVGMFEHVWHKNYRTLMEVLDRCLKPQPMCLLHTIGKNHNRMGLEPWTAEYTFPNGEIPSMRRISTAVESRLVVEDWHNFGPDYDKTLMAWFRNFDGAWGRLKDNYSETFYRGGNTICSLTLGLFEPAGCSCGRLFFPMACQTRPIDVQSNFVSAHRHRMVDGEPWSLGWLGQLSAAHVQGALHMQVIVKGAHLYTPAMHDDARYGAIVCAVKRKG